jgi:hypothetical protein
MIPTVREDFQLTCMKGEMGIEGCGARTIPGFQAAASMYPQVGEIGGDVSGARTKIDASSG